MKKIFSLLAMLMVCISLYAENSPTDKSNVSGKIVDGKTNAPVEYATVALYNQETNALVSGTITTPQGDFTIPGVKSGTYILRASFIGYNTTELKDIKVEGHDKNLGVIKLETSDAEIEEVEVTAKKNSVEYKIDKKVVNIASDINGDNGSAAEALEGVPSVDVDIDGNVTLRGSSNFTVLIDGKPTALDADEVLKQTPAALIQNIEIITNPSAKYDPEGSTGIINLVTKKNVVQGVNGAVNANVGSFGRYGGDFLLNLRKNKINYFVGGNYNKRGFNFNNYSDRITYAEEYDKYVNQESHMKRRFGGGGLKAGIDYYANDNNIFNFSVEGGKWGSNNDGNTGYNNWMLSKVTNSEYNRENVSSITDNGDDSYYLNTNMSWTHNFAGQGHKLIINGFYSRNNRDDNQDFMQTAISVSDNTKRITGHMVNEDKTTNRGRINIDYTKPFDNGAKFEAGMQEDFNQSDSDYDFDDYVSATNSYAVNSDYTHDITFKRYITAVYSTFATNLAGFGVQLGLRGEYTYRLIDTKVEGGEYKINRPDFFPTLHISRALGETNSIQLGYSRRIRRPWEWFLNPFPMYSDEYSKRLGNPALKPEYTDAIELNYQKNFDKMFWALETFYRHTDGATENVSTLATDGSDILISRFENLSNNNNFGLELTGNYDPFKWMTVNVDLEMRKYYISGNYNGQDLSREGSSWRTKETVSFNPGKTTKIQVNFRYNGANKTLISDNKGEMDFGLAVRQSFMKKRLSVSLAMRDIFNTRTHKSETYTDTYYLYSKRYRDAPVWNIGLSYKINNFKEKGPGGMGGDEGGSFEGGEGDF